MKLNDFKPSGLYGTLSPLQGLMVNVFRPPCLYYKNYDNPGIGSTTFLNRTSDENKKSGCNQIAIKLKSD